MYILYLYSKMTVIFNLLILELIFLPQAIQCYDVNSIFWHVYKLIFVNEYVLLTLQKYINCSRF